MRIRFAVGTADSEYGCACHHMSRLRNRQCRNCPPLRLAAGRGARPVMVTETTPGASCSTACDRHPVPQAARERQAPAVDDDGAGGREPEREPPGRGQRVAHEGRAGEDLVRHRERDREVGVQVDGPPGLVLHLAAHVAVRGDGRHDQQAGRRRRRAACRGTSSSGRRARATARAHLRGVAEDDGDDVHADQAEDRRARACGAA